MKELHVSPLRLLVISTFLLFTTSTFAAELLHHEAYVWQRQWNAQVRDALSLTQSNLDGYVALAAEVSWVNGQPQVVRVPVDWPALRRTGKPFGVALRIGAYHGPFADQGDPVTFLANLSEALLKEAGQAAELQIDFDCATANLTGYQVWAKSIRQRITPTPLIITVLPSWLSSSNFVRLAATTDGYILQIHSLGHPSSTNTTLTLCDPPTARTAVRRAAQIAIPFRVALPTYGYLVAFDPEDKFVGISAEGPLKAWPANITLRTVRAEAAAIAQLVQEWTKVPPTNLKGFIWYRLPTENDSLNWRWITLAAIIHGQIPKANVQAYSRRNSNGLIEIELLNIGTADTVFPAEIIAQWHSAEIVASDAIAGYERLDTDSQKIILRAKPSLNLQRLAPGEGRTIGWLRLSADKEIDVYVSPRQ